MTVLIKNFLRNNQIYFRIWNSKKKKFSLKHFHNNILLNLISIIILYKCYDILIGNSVAKPNFL